MVCKALFVHFTKVLKYSGYVLTVSELEKYMESVSSLTYLPVCIKSSVVWVYQDVYIQVYVTRLTPDPNSCHYV